MFKKLSNSLMSPKEVAKYYHEPLWKTLIMFLVLLFFMMVPTIVNLLTYNFLSYQTKEDIKYAFYKEEIPFKIEEGIIKHIDDNSEEVYINSKYNDMIIVFTEKLDTYKVELDSQAIIFCEDGVYMKLAVASQKIIEFADYAYFKNIDFTTDGLLKDTDFWNNTFSILQKLIDDYKPVYITTYSIYNFFYWIIWLSIFCLIITMFAKMRVFNALKFGDLFKIAYYSLAPFVVCSVLSSLFNLGFLIYVGYMVSAIYNIITVNEVLKNTYSVRREGE